MSMNSNAYSLHPIGNSHCGQLFYDNVATGRILEGLWLKHCFHTPSGALLFVMDDSLYEFNLHIYLLNGLHHILDHVNIHRMYAAGELNDLRTRGDRQFEFAFFDKDHWLVRVRMRPRLGLHLPWPWRESHRDSLFGRHWLVLHRMSD